MAKSPEEMAAAMKRNIEEKTGKTLPHWLKIIQPEKLEKHGQIVKFLKSEHAVTHGFASMIAHEFLAGNKSAGAPESPLDHQYRNAKSGLRPIYDALVKSIETLGDDIQFAPKKTYVSVRRNKQFAIIQPSTKDRVDVGINLKGKKSTKRLEDSGSFNAMVSHRVRITEAKQVNAQLLGWLKSAYEAS
ncbi:MAG: DUF5655 domain-containing protein [Pirellulaceae bacterium]|nr:DUF5655 domain-containing protein [Pirellulaceae bacterium]